MSVSLILEMRERHKNSYDEILESYKKYEGLPYEEYAKKLDEEHAKSSELFKQNRKEEDELYRTLTLQQWMNELDTNLKGTLDLLDCGILESVKSQLTIKEKEDLAIYAFTEHKTVITYLSDELCSINKEIRDVIIKDSPKNVNKINNLTFDEKMTVLSTFKTSHTISHLQKGCDFGEEELLLTYYLTIGEKNSFYNIENWKEKLTSEMITIIINTSTDHADFTYAKIKDAYNFKPHHEYMLIKKEPSIIGLIEDFEERFSDIYLKMKDFKDNKHHAEVEALMELYNSWHTLPSYLHPLFIKNWYGVSIVKFEDLYKAYKAVYS